MLFVTLQVSFVYLDFLKERLDNALLFFLTTPAATRLYSDNTSNRSLSYKST